jgi:hypothetical protein
VPLTLCSIHQSMNRCKSMDLAHNLRCHIRVLGRDDTSPGPAAMPPWQVGRTCYLSGASRRPQSYRRTHPGVAPPHFVPPTTDRPAARDQCALAAGHHGKQWILPRRPLSLGHISTPIATTNHREVVGPHRQRERCAGWRGFNVPVTVDRIGLHLMQSSAKVSHVNG